MLAALWGRLQGWLLMAGAVLLVLVGAYAAGGRAARRSAELDKAAANAKVREVRDETVAKIERMDDDAVRNRARERMRKSAQR